MDEQTTICEGRYVPLSQAYPRAAVLEEARTWLRTPFHHEGRSKGAGVDCAMLLAEVYERAGQIPRVLPEHYPHDWHLHRDEERFLAWLLKFAHQVEEPLPGDIAIFRIGRTWSHGAIVINWPIVIHAWFETTVEYADASKTPLSGFPVRFYTLKEWKA
jgi:cell wall-associated NlpC family hydrolase